MCFISDKNFLLTAELLHSTVSFIEFFKMKLEIFLLFCHRRCGSGRVKRVSSLFINETTQNIIVRHFNTKIFRDTILSEHV